MTSKVVPSFALTCNVFNERALALLPTNRDLFAATDTATGRVVGYAHLVRPETAPYSLDKQIRVGLLSLPFVWGMNVFARILQMPPAMERQEAVVMRAAGVAGRKYMKLERVSVDPEFQGCGSSATAAKWD